MKLPLSWLKEYVDIKGQDPQKISDGLRFSGTENVLVVGVELDEHIVVGEIKEIAKHPNADKLQVTKTDVGKANGGLLQIVCGASNIEVGQKVPVALVGTKFPDFEIKKAKIRDVESNGMLCAEDELGLGEDHSGIMILDDGAKIGQKLSDHLGGGEVVIDAELTPNRGDCLSMVGMAREVGATFGRKFSMPVIKKPEISSKKTIEVEVKDKELCPRYIAKVVEGIKIGPSPKWMQERLIAAGVRPISNVVDVTNYVMLELGQPLHAFDATKLSGKIIVRRAKKGDKLTTLDGQDRKLTADDLLICDAKKPVALAGVMGGLNSEIDDKTATIVLEAAVFDPTSIRKTAQRLNLRSEASNRFEKGIPLTLPEVSIERAAELLIAISDKPKAMAIGQNTDVLSSWIWVQHVGLRLFQVERHLGVSIDRAKSLEILRSLGFEAEEFDFKAEARKHVGKPYVFGASYKTHGDMAFDCSYLTDYIYSRIGKFIGFTSLAQYELGTPVKVEDLQPGDILFLKGHIDKSATDHYFVPTGGGKYERVTLQEPREVGHNALYIGNGRIVHARHFTYDPKAKKWKKLPEGKVVEEGVEAFTKNPEYLGARRFVNDPNDLVAITVPWWRLDVRIEEDILEELVRIYGYDKIPSKLPSGILSGEVGSKQQVIEGDLKEKLAHLGFTEVITYSFVSEKLVKISGTDSETLPRITNPLSVDQEYMRGSIWPSILEVAAKNQNYDTLRLFEIANVYKGDSQELHLSAAVKAGTGKDSFYDLKGLLWSLLHEFDIPDLSVRPFAAPFSDPGQGAEVLAGSKSIGYFGIVSKKTREQFGQKSDLAIAEINISKLIGSYGRQVVYKPLPKFPRAKRDVNVVLDDSVLAADIIKAIATANVANLASYMILDIYEGKALRRDKEGANNLSNAKKSVTISLEFGSQEKTLTDEEIEKSVSVTVKSLSKIGGELRS